MRPFLSLFAATAALLLCLLGSPPAQAGMPPHAAHGQPEIRVGIVLFDQVQIIDFAGPYEVFGQAGFGVATVSAQGQPVTTAMGLRVTPDYSFADAPPFDVLLVPGGETEKAAADPVILDFVRRRGGDARHVLSVCTGAFILASAGLLDGSRATTFHQALDGLATHYPRIHVVRDQRWVDNGKVITSAGLSSGLDAALHVVARLRGEDAARTAALHLEYDWRPEQGFVRGRLADRWFPKLADVAWPKDIAFERISSIGDERQWRSRHRVRTAMETGELMRRIAAGLDGEGWQRPAGEGYRWQREVDGHRLDLVFGARPDGEGAHAIETTLHVDDAGVATY